MASVCNHPLPHPRLEGRTSAGSTYLYKVVTKYVEGVILDLDNFGEIIIGTTQLSFEAYLKDPSGLNRFAGPCING